MIGRTIGNYRITEKIGEGGMGTVFKGFDLMLQRDVAIKMLRPELATQTKVVERFHTEAIALAKLNHTNIATVYNFLNHDDDYFMVMEYVPGDTLARIIKSQGAVQVERATTLFLQALDAVSHAHEMGVIHRDIKPANILLSETGVLKLTDFGIARVIGTARITRRGSVVGTIEYMSPEQILGEEGDERSDIYSLGILLYEMLLGRVPFESDSEFELMKSQVEQLPPPPRTVSAHIPLEVEEVIMRSLAKKSEARFQTALEFRAALENSLRPFTVPLGEPLPTDPVEKFSPLYAAPATRPDEPSTVAEPAIVAETLMVASANPQPELTVRLGASLSEINNASTAHDTDQKESLTRAYGSDEMEAFPHRSSGETKLAGTLSPMASLAVDKTQEYTGRVSPSNAPKESMEIEIIKPSSQKPLFKIREWKYYAALILFLMLLLSWVAFNQGVDGNDSSQTSEAVPSVTNQSVVPIPLSAPAQTQKPENEQPDSNASPDDNNHSRNAGSVQENTESNRKPAPGVVRRKAGQVGRIFKKIVRLGQ
jgi:serine/threonine-protein kinase